MQVDLQIDHCWLLLNRRAPPDTQAFKVFEPTGYNAGRSLHCSPTRRCSYPYRSPYSYRTGRYR